MDYQKEYDEYWSRADRWGSHSFRNPDVIADQILSVCGNGRILDAGFGMGLLIKTLLQRGIEAHGMDIAERVVAEANQFAPGHFKTGSLLAMPYENESFETIVSTDCLEHIAEVDVPKALAEFHRVARRFVFIQLATTPDRDKRWHLSIHNRTWWEQQFFAAGFRKHPAIQTVLPYESLEQESWQITLVLEKIPAAALAQYPLTALKAERDLHMDMLRESGRRSDAHIARYMLARQFLPKEGLVLDAACGLGYGSAALAHGAPGVRVIGLDSSAYAVNYAKANFTGVFPNVEFREGDVNQLVNIADASVSLVASFETVEHLREPELFLAEVRRVLKPGGVFLSSVPNLWVDETGKDPNPHHFHVFDFPKLAALCRKFFALREVYRQSAGGGMRLPKAARELRRVHLPVTSEADRAEWWLVAGVKEERVAAFQVESPSLPRSGGEGRGEEALIANTRDLVGEVDAPLRSRGERANRPSLAVSSCASSSVSNQELILLTSDPTHPLYASWVPSWEGPWRALNPAHTDVEMLRKAALVVTHDTYLDPGRKLVRELVAAGIPTLILADGILDYRNTWEHPQLEPGAIFQPVLGHKIACIGRSQARVLESWGNIGKCEIVGSPRFDRYCELRRRQKRDDEPFRILVMTALTPWFTESQHQAVKAALRDLKDFFAAHRGIGGFGVEPVWRLTKGLDAEIGLEPNDAKMDFSGKELSEILQQVDAVITTPSTAMLEAMLLGLPLAALDYTNSPFYVEPAWRITARAHISTVIAELMRPQEPKMLFQETTLHDALECATPATPRLIGLIREMMERVAEARTAASPVDFPERILRSETGRHAIKENRFHPEALYPAQKPQPAPASQNGASKHRHSIFKAFSGNGKQNGAINGHRNGNGSEPHTNGKSGFDRVTRIGSVSPSLPRSGGEGRGEEALNAKSRDLVGEMNTPLSNSLPARPSQGEREEGSSRAVSSTSQSTVSFKKRKIVFVSHNASRSGAPMQLLNIIRAARAGWEPRILLREGGPLEPEFQALGETIVCATPEIQPEQLEDAWLVYSNTCTNGLFLRTIPPEGPPVLTHMHELAFAIDNFGPQNFELVKRQTSHFIACSQTVSQVLQQRGISAGKISLIHENICAADVRERAAEKSVEDARRWCGLDENDFVVGACGFADWRKGPDLFLQLADSLRRRNGESPKLTFLWIGRLPADSAGRILLHDLQRLGLGATVKFIGEQDNPYPFLNACDVFCSCSREDPFPLVMLEAAALCKPTVCFEESGGAPEFCARGAGFTVPYLNLNAMGEMLLQLAHDNKLRIGTGERAGKIVEENFETSDLTPRIVQFIEKFSKAPPPKPLPPPPPPTFVMRLKDFRKSLVGV